MSLFSGIGTSSGGALDVGAVKATLGYDHDTRGLRDWDRKVDKARRDSRKAIEQDLKADYDGRGFREYERATDKAHRSSGLLLRASTSLGGLRGVAYGAGAVGVAVGVGFVAFTKKAIEASSDLNESLNASEAIFESSGKKVTSWSRKTADAFGLTRSEALQGAASIGAMLKPMGFVVGEASSMSMKMVELAGDMASFNNQDPAEMLERLRSGLAGESEPLRQFGVDLRLTAVEQFALKEGIIKTGEKLEGQKQVYAMYQKILADTKDQQGDFGRTSEGMANAQRRLKANFEDLTAVAGDAFRPAMQGSLSALNDFLVQMKEGKGVGGDFARFLGEAGEDVEGFAEKINHVLSDKTLDPKAKAEKIFGMFGAVAEKAIDAAVPVIANAAASAAPKVADRFVEGFTHANAWGRIALGAFLITKLGGLSTILKGVGLKMGGEVATGAAEGIAGGAAAGGAAAGAGGLIGKIKAIKWGRIGAIGLGAVLANGVMDEFQNEAEKQSDDVVAAIEAKTDHRSIVEKSLNIDLPGFLNPTFSKLFGGNDDEDRRLKNIKAQFEEIATTRGRISVQTEASLRQQVREADLTTSQRKQVERMLDLYRQGRQLNTGVDIEMDPKKLAQIRTDMDRLKAGVFTNSKDIEKTSQRAAKAIAEEFGSGTKEARDLTAQNMRATADAISKQMKEAGNVTEAGMKRVRRLIRGADLMEGLHPNEFGQQFARAFGNAESVTKKNLDGVISQFRQLPKGARQATYDAMNEQLRELRKGGKLSQGEVKQIRSRMLAEFGGLKTDTVRSTAAMVTGVLGNFGGLGNGIAAALSVIQENTNAGLASFNVQEKKFVVKTLGNLGWTGAAKKARGGYLDGPSRGDVVPVLAGRDEAFVTSWQQQPINAALAFANAAGVVPYNHLGAVFADEKRNHSGGPAVQRRAQGGTAAGGPAQTFPGVSIIRNDSKDAGNEVGSVNKALAVMERLAAAHIPYVWGGGHGGFDSSPGGLDCSGAVSLVLHEAGLLASPLVSGALESWGKPGPGAITVYANPTHAWMEVNGRPWGTSVNDSSHGLGFYGEPSAGYKSGFTARHAAGAVMSELAKVSLTGMGGPLGEMGQNAVDQVWKGANDYLKKSMPNTTGGGDANVMGPGDLKQYNHTYPKHALGQAGGTRFSEALTAQIAAWAGLPGRTFGQIAHGESDFYPGSWGVDPGGTVGRGLWAITSGVGNDAMIARYGGPGAMFNPLVNAQVAKEIYDGAGQTISPWYGTKFVTNAAQGGFARRASGGYAAKISKKIKGLWKTLTGTKGKKDRNDIRDEIDSLQARLSKRRKAQRQGAFKKIRAKGGMDGYAGKIGNQQSKIEHLEEQLGGIEEVNQLTEPRDVDAVMKQFHVDPESDLSKLSDEKKDAVRKAIDNDVKREERELKDEVAYTNKELKALLTLRKMILAGITEAKRRIARAQKRAKNAEDEQQRLREAAEKVAAELKKLHSELHDLEGGKPPKKQKGESDKEHKKKVEAWDNNRKGIKRDLEERIDRHESRRHDLLERAQGWGSAAKGYRENISDLGSWLSDDAEPALTDAQGTDRTMDPDVKVGALGQGGSPQFGGRILDTQVKLANLQSTEFVRADPFSAGGFGEVGGEGDGGGGAGAGGGDGSGEDGPTEMDYAQRDLAAAELTPDPQDDRDARLEILTAAQNEYNAALATPDPRDDVGAAGTLKAAREAVAGDEADAEREKLNEERVKLLEEENERWRRNALVMGAQAPAFAAANAFPNFLQQGGFAGLDDLAQAFVGSYRIGTEFVPRDGLAMVHRGEKIQSRERVAEGGGRGDTHVILTGGLEWLSPYVQAHVTDELDARGEQAAAASRRPAAGVIARKASR